LKKFNSSRLQGPQNQFQPDFARIGIIDFFTEFSPAKTLISQQKKPPQTKLFHS